MLINFRNYFNSLDDFVLFLVNSGHRRKKKINIFSWPLFPLFCFLYVKIVEWPNLLFIWIHCLKITSTDRRQFYAVRKNLFIFSARQWLRALVWVELYFFPYFFCFGLHAICVRWRLWDTSLVRFFALVSSLRTVSNVRSVHVLFGYWYTYYFFFSFSCLRIGYFFILFFFFDFFFLLRSFFRRFTYISHHWKLKLCRELKKVSEKYVSIFTFDILFYKFSITHAIRGVPCGVLYEKLAVVLKRLVWIE